MGSSRDYWCPYCDTDASDHFHLGYHCKEERLYSVWSALKRSCDPNPGRYVGQFLPHLKELIQKVPVAYSSYLDTGEIDALLGKIRKWAEMGELLVESDTYELERLSRALREALRNRDKRTTLVTAIINNLPYRGVDGTLEVLSEI